MSTIKYFSFEKKLKDIGLKMTDIIARVTIGENDMEETRLSVSIVGEHGESVVYCSESIGANVYVNGADDLHNLIYRLHQIMLNNLVCLNPSSQEPQIIEWSSEKNGYFKKRPALNEEIIRLRKFYT